MISYRQARELVRREYNQNGKPIGRILRRIEELITVDPLLIYAVGDAMGYRRPSNRRTGKLRPRGRPFGRGFDARRSARGQGRRDSE